MGSPARRLPKLRANWFSDTDDEPASVRLVSPGTQLLFFLIPHTNRGLQVEVYMTTAQSDVETAASDFAYAAHALR